MQVTLKLKLCTLVTRSSAYPEPKTILNDTSTMFCETGCGQKLLQLEKMAQGKMYHLTATPTYKITPPMFATRCFGTVSVSFSRRKARDKTCSPPEIHLTVLFVHEVLEQTRNMDTFWGGIISKVSSTLPLEMLSMKYSMAKML